MSFGERVKHRREMLKDFSQEKLAKMLGYEGRAAINKVEKGLVKVPQDKVENYARALKTSPAYLMGWVDDPELTHEQTIELERQGNLKIQQNPNDKSLLTNRLNAQLGNIEFALFDEIKDLTDEQKKDILDFVRFKKQQKNN